MLFGSGGLESRLARFLFTPIRTATKRASGGKSANKNTAGRRLGPKMGEGEPVQAGQIIWRQRGTKWYPGENAGIGRDHTIFAKEPGFVRYYRDPFHPRRRFIGIALEAAARLPTPHFEPRKRRFGYTPIDNEEIAQFELDFLTRKETKRLAERDQILAQRAERQKARLDSYETTLTGAGFASNADAIKLQAVTRLDSIYQFMCGGMTYAEARDTVDSHAREDLDIDLRVGRLTPEEHNAQVEEYSKLVAEVDGLVAFSESRKLSSVTELSSKAREDAVARIADVTKPYMESADGTPADVVKEVLSILSSTSAFSDSDVAHLKRKFLRRPSSVLATAENLPELEKRAKKGDGELRKVWNDRESRTQVYFVPKNGKLVF